MPVSDKIKFAAKQVIGVCLKLKPGEQICFIGDKSTLHLHEAMRDVAAKYTDKLKLFVMDDFGPRSKDGKNSLKMPEEILAYLKNCQTAVYGAYPYPGEVTTFRIPMINAAVENNLRFAHMGPLTDEVMEEGMSADYNEVIRVSHAVYNIVKHAKKAHVTTPAGADFIAEFDPNFKWGVGDGDIKPKLWQNLPGGEVFTCPKTLNGTVIVDGVIGDMVHFGIIEKTPLKWKVKDGRVVEISCKNKEIEDSMKALIKKCENADRIGEFGIGTNVGIKKLIGHAVQDEKFPGVHVAIGSTTPVYTNATWNSDVHCDVIMQKVTLEVDGRVILKDGKFLI